MSAIVQFHPISEVRSQTLFTVGQYLMVETRHTLILTRHLMYFPLVPGYGCLSPGRQPNFLIGAITELL